MNRAKFLIKLSEVTFLAAVGSVIGFPTITETGTPISEYEEDLRFIYLSIPKNRGFAVVTQAQRLSNPMWQAGEFVWQSNFKKGFRYFDGKLWYTVVDCFSD